VHGSPENSGIVRELTRLQLPGSRLSAMVGPPELTEWETLLQDLVTPFVTLFVTIDPPGLAPLFLALTGGMDRSARKRVAMRCTIIGFAVLLMFAVAGTAILETLGITIHAFRIAGGFLLFWIAFEMIFEKRQDRHEKSAERVVNSDEIHSLAVFPLAIPLIAGPGAISATILLSDQFVSIVDRGKLIAIIGGIISLTFIIFVLAERVDRFLGITGRMVLTRLLGVILAALAVQFVADGIFALISVHANDPAV
jgi:multiple antibiotic resistance protein